MKTMLLLAASALALSAGGCSPKAPALSAKLDCPSTQGDLTRVSAAVDGQSCLYREDDGAEVTLTRIAVKGDVDATLGAYETELKALGGTPLETSDRDKAEAAKAVAEDARAEAEDAKAQAEDAKAMSHDAKAAAEDARAAAAEARAVAAQAKADARVFSGKFQAKVEDDEDGGETTRVDLPGLHISAKGDKADVNVGPIHVDADGESSVATVKIRRDVRLRGEAMSREKHGVRATFIYAGENLSGGYRYLGYEAAGPRTGPLTIAVVKSKSGNEEHSDMYDDVKKLVRRNGGV